MLLREKSAKMHTTITRAQNVFGFFTTVCFVVAALIACSDLLAPRTPSSKVIVKDVQVYVDPPLLPCRPHISPQNYSANRYYPTESEADHTTTQIKRKNTRTSAFPFLPTSPPSSHGTPNRSSSGYPLRGLRQTPLTRLSFGIRSSLVQVRITC